MTATQLQYLIPQVGDIMKGYLEYEIIDVTDDIVTVATQGACARLTRHGHHIGQLVIHPSGMFVVNGISVFWEHEDTEFHEGHCATGHNAPDIPDWS